MPSPMCSEGEVFDVVAGGMLVLPTKETHKNLGLPLNFSSLARTRRRIRTGT